MSEPLEHTYDCQRHTEARERVRERWRYNWPNHCRRCEANTDSGDPCPFCLAQLVCPRCGASDSLDAEDATVPCAVCGWVENAGMGCPAPYECTCAVGRIKVLDAEIALLGLQRSALNAQIDKLKRKLARLKRQKRR